MLDATPCTGTIDQYAFFFFKGGVLQLVKLDTVPVLKKVAERGGGGGGGGGRLRHFFSPS